MTDPKKGIRRFETFFNFRFMCMGTYIWKPLFSWIGPLSILKWLEPQMYIKWFMRRCAYKTAETYCTGQTDEWKDGLHYHYKPPLYNVVFNWVSKRQLYTQNKVEELRSLLGYRTASNVCKYMHFNITIKSVC